MEKMVVDVHSNYHSRYCRWVVSITTACALVLSSSPVNVFALVGDGEKVAKELVVEYETLDFKGITACFDSIEASEDPYREAVGFLEAFLAEIEMKHGVSLSLLEACELVQSNLDLLDIDEKAKSVLLSFIELLESDPKIGKIVHGGFYWPWEWNWFGLNKKDKNLENPQEKTAGQQPVHEGDFSGSVYVGGAEILAGALTCVLGIVCTPAIGLGGALMLDGIRRIADDLVDNEKAEAFPPNAPYEE